MDADYIELINETINSLSKAVLANETRLRQRGLDIDHDVLVLLRRIGAGVVQKVLSDLADAVSEEAARADPTLVVQRRTAIRLESIFGAVAIDSPSTTDGMSAEPVCCG